MQQSTDHFFLDDSLATTDELLEGIFDILNKTGNLDNTIIVGSSDHGDDILAFYVRLSALSSNVLHAASYIYYPKQLMPDPRIANQLRRNTDQLTSTLDLYPTILGILQGGYNFLTRSGQGCITGVDLAAIDIPDNRTVISWDAVSGYGAITHLWGLSTKKGGTLYHRRWRHHYPPLQQGKDDDYILEYGNCTTWLCKHKPTKNDYENFKRALHWVSSSPLIGEDVKNSEITHFFANLIDKSLG